MAFNDDRDLVRWIPGRWTTLRVSRRTWYRWMDGKSRIPHAVVLLARLLVNGELGTIDARWNGWRLLRGKLWDSANQWHTPDTILTWHWTRQAMNFIRPKTNYERAVQRETYRRLLIATATAVATNAPRNKREQRNNNEVFDLVIHDQSKP